jgi:cytoskeleton protein RodZ
MGAESAEMEVDTEQSMSLGKRLKAAREAHDIEINDIARWLKLDQKLIHALENDDEAQLPSPVFTAGYIRSYARLVELPADELVADYMQAHEPPAPAVNKPEEPLAGRHAKVEESLPKSFSVASGSSARGLKWIALAAVAVAVVGGAGWYSVQFFSTQSEKPSADDNRDVVTQPQTGQSMQSANLNEPLEQDKPAQEPAAGQAAVDKPAPERVTVPLPLNKRERSDPGFVAQMHENGGAAQPQLSRISLEFVEDSWIDIRDATGERLIRRMGLAGSSKQVEGVAPFQVLIGYGPGVKMQYNGEPFDFSKYQGKQEVARFTLQKPENQSAD